MANNGDGTITALNASTHAVIGSAFAGSGVVGVSVHPDSGTVYAVASQDGLVRVLDAATLAIVDTIPVGDSPNAFGHFIGPPPRGLGGDVTQQLLIAVLCINVDTSQVGGAALLRALRPGTARPRVS